MSRVGYPRQANRFKTCMYTGINDTLTTYKKKRDLLLALSDNTKGGEKKRFNSRRTACALCEVASSDEKDVSLRSL